MSTVHNPLELLMDQENWTYTEGPRGVRNLTKVIETLGYREFSSIHPFLEDNPGCIEAILKWIGEQGLPEWRAKLVDELDPEHLDRLSEMEDSEEP